MSQLSSADIESEVHALRNAIKVLSCAIGYSLEHPKGPVRRSDNNLDVQLYELDAAVLTTAMDRVAELSDELYRKASA